MSTTVEALAQWYGSREVAEQVASGSLGSLERTMKLMERVKKPRAENPHLRSMQKSRALANEAQQKKAAALRARVDPVIRERYLSTAPNELWTLARSLGVSRAWLQDRARELGLKRQPGPQGDAEVKQAVIRAPSRGGALVQQALANRSALEQAWGGV